MRLSVLLQICETDEALCPAPTKELAGSADETIHAMRDYFDMLRCGYIEKHTPETWRSFLDGYLTMAAMYAETE